MLKPSMKKAAVTNPAKKVCRKRYNALGFASSAPKSVICARPLTISYPTGCCIKPLAARIQNADRLPPMATIHITAACSFFEMRSQPKIHTPRKVDSRKKASSPSTASGAPKTSPTKREYSDQFMPNWNSITMPVTTPMA